MIRYADDIYSRSLSPTAHFVAVGCGGLYKHQNKLFVSSPHLRTFSTAIYKIIIFCSIVSFSNL